MMKNKIVSFCRNTGNHPFLAPWGLMLLLLLVFTSYGNPIAVAADTLGGSHVDKTLGFSIRVPQDWNFVASPDNERYIVATFISERLLTTKKAKEWKERGANRPEMRIIAFTPENVSLADTKEKKEELFGKKITVMTQSNPYKDFKEYLKRTLKGYYPTEDITSKVGKVTCTQFDAIMEQHRPPLRRVCCIYHLEDIDIAVYFEVMEEWYPKYKSLFDKAFKSFKTVKRELEDAVAGEGSSTKPVTRKDFIHSKTANLPEGWWYDVSKSHLVISHADKKYSGKISSFSDAIRKAIEKDLAGKKTKGSSSKKEKAEMPIIRICNSVGEYNAYCDTSKGFEAYNPETQEVIVYDGTREGYDIDWAFSKIGNGIFLQYLYDEFRFAQPDTWFTFGNRFYYSNFKGKGSSCKFVPNTYVSELLRKAERNGECKTLKALLDSKGRGIQGNEDYWKVGSLVSFLKSRAGNKKPWKGILNLYLNNFRSAYSELDKKTGKDIDDVGETKDKDEAKKKAKEVTTRITEFSKEVRKKAFEATFGNWDETDWERLEKAWKDWAL